MNLVFASGFLVPQQLLGIDYFRGLDAHLEGRHKAIFPEVPVLGSVEERADGLAAAIQEAYPDGPIHIIAHSMGGLDCRSLIARNLHKLADPGRIASLTTLATPHRGSPLADLLVDPSPSDLSSLIFGVIRDAITFLDIETSALRNLTTESASRVPDPIPTHPHIRFRSFAAAGRPGLLRTCFALLPTHRHIKKVTGQDNDGVVTVDSARYGEFQQPFLACDHIDVVGHNLDTADLKFQFNHFTAIDAIISKL